MTKKTNLVESGLLVGLLVLAGIVLLAAKGAASAAEDRYPADYASKATTYLASRMAADARPRFELRSAPYAVRARLTRDMAYDCWAVDVHARADMGRRLSADTYTVIFYGDQPVALESDLKKSIARRDAPAIQLAGN